jgi:PD-(D/E)XK nuclease superfamily
VLAQSTVSFFAQMLGASAHREVKLSRAFAACFSASCTFRRVTLQAICRSCRLPPRAAKLDSWRCETEPRVSQGRLDIRLTPGSEGLQTLVLENKVAAPLTKEQLLRYRSAGSRFRLVAITKRYPEVGLTWLEKNRVVSLRWQDIHRALGVLPDARGADRFICLAFRAYLEELDMAHREDLTKADVSRVTRLFAAIAASRKSEIDAESAFRAAADLLALLDEVLRHSRERQPELEAWKRWGPSYFKWREREGPSSHFLAFRLLKHGWQEWFGAGIMFEDGSHDAYWVVSGQPTKRGEYIEEQHAIAKVCKRNGSLDADRMVRLYLDGLATSGMLRNGRGSATRR